MDQWLGSRPHASAAGIKKPNTAFAQRQILVVSSFHLYQDFGADYGENVALGVDDAKLLSRDLPGRIFLGKGKFGQREV